jgi:N-terminal domain of toast_rack, DUF2154/Domain of unknown function (DUF5668)
MAQDASPRRVSLVGPIILISIGALFLLHNWRPDFEPWPVLLTYWPLILIFIGLGKIWDHMQRSRNPNAPSSSIGSTIAILACVFVLIALIWHGRSYSRRFSWDSRTRHVTRVVEPQKAKSATARLNMGSGQLTINGGAADLVDADFDFGRSFDDPRVDYSVSDGVGHLTIEQGGNSVHFGNARNDWNLRFSKDIPLDLRVDLGAGQGNLHFRDVPLTNLDLNMGAGQVDVDLTGDRTADMNVDIEGGVGQANIRLPKNVGVVAHASGGIGSIDVRGLKHDGDTYTNDVVGKTKATIHLKVEGGIGQIVLTEEP